jgi:hypothetical protein
MMVSPLDVKFLRFKEETRPAVKNRAGYELQKEMTIFVIKNPKNGEEKPKEKTVTSYARKDISKRPEEIRKEIERKIVEAMKQANFVPSDLPAVS